MTNLLVKEKIYNLQIDPKNIEKIIKKNFTLCWRWYYKMQIPTMVQYQKIFKDLISFHIWGTITMNQAFNLKINQNKKDYDHFLDELLRIKEKNETLGVSAMSISEMTGIPRATVIRKCKFLIDSKFIAMNDKKQYLLTESNKYSIAPFQKILFKKKATFLTRILNLTSVYKN